MKFATFRKKLKKIRKMGYIKTSRAGNTGVGHTLEQLLKLTENNIALPDLGGKIELKVQRKSASNRITLFTKSPNWILKPKELITTYGYKNGKGRMAIYNTMSGNKNSRGFMIKPDPKGQKLQVLINGKPVAWWDTKTLEKTFKEKLRRLIVVKAASRGKGKDENFFYNKAYLLSGGINMKTLLQLIKKGDLVIEFRMHIKESGTVRDHGTAFRISENKIDSLFREKLDLLK